MPEAKRKLPPTFRHYPINRAKKLKQNWVENAKIKSKWKAQKRREGLASSSKKLNLESEADDDEVGGGGRQSDIDEDVPTEQAVVQVHPSRSQKYPNLVPTPPKEKKEEHIESTPGPSVRQLKREAYSKNALHTYKADPLKRRRSQSDSHPSPSNTTARRGTRGRGQPNMKLRMNAMLAQIKQQYSNP